MRSKLDGEPLPVRPGVTADGLFDRFRPTAAKAAMSLWRGYGRSLVKAGVDLDDVRQEADVRLLELISDRLDPSDKYADWMVYKSVHGHLMNVFVTGELVRFSHESIDQPGVDLGETDDNLTDIQSETLLYLRGDDRRFALLVVNGHRPLQAKKLMGWSKREFREAVERIAEALNVER